jgi:hypothetical protein
LINDVLLICISKSWSGFEAAWVNKPVQPQQINRNVNEKWGKEQHYEPVTGEVNIGDFV